eukprot:gene8458-8642_t
MDVAKRLDFDPTDTLSGLGVQDAAHLRFQSANLSALQELERAVHELSATSKQKHTQILDLARQSAEQGIGDNDLKRLQRQFDSNKATLFNIEQKKRFMGGVANLELDIEQLTADKDQQEQQLEEKAEALRTLKAQNVQHAQAEAQQLLDAETAKARDLEKTIAEAEAMLADLESKAATSSQQLTALQAEVQQLEGLASDRAKEADAEAHIRDAAKWCDAMLQLNTLLSGLTVQDASIEQLVLGITASLKPGCVDTDDVVEAVAAGDKDMTDLQPLSTVLREIRGRLTPYWQRKVLVEAAAEVYPPSSSCVGPLHVAALLPNQLEAEVLVPASWPSVPCSRLQLVRLNSPELHDQMAADITDCINKDVQLLHSCDLLGLLKHVAAAAEARILDAAAAKML